MLIIGITGNIGSGKSTVCQILAKLGVPTIDADKLAHEAYKPHSQIWQELINVFGKNIVKVNGEIDRQKLGQIVFSSPHALAQLNRIVHPCIYCMVQERIENYSRQGVEAVAVEAALLVEADWTKLVDKIWLVMASDNTASQRLTQHKEISTVQILSRLRSQMPAREKMKYADEIIYNDGDMAQLETRVTELWHRFSTR